jgi:hypothetical protein
MSVSDQAYETKHLIQFLKEEFERIITQCGLALGDSVLSDARALAIWFLHQEVGVPYDEANRCVLDDKNDGGVDFIWQDKDSKRVLVGQVEYDSRDWSKGPASQKKAIETFSRFLGYLDTDSLPKDLNEPAIRAWRHAKLLIKRERYAVRYYFVTPKNFSDAQRERIRRESGLREYDFFTHDELLERGEEFLDGQTGMTSFKVPFNSKPLKLDFDYGQVFVISVGLKSIHKIVESHEREKKLRALFASNVRSYLNIKKRSREIALEIRNTIEQKPDHFIVCNNGVTILCSKASLNSDHISLERASISNGCQTVMNVDRYFRDNDGANPNAEVLVTVIELKKNAADIAAEIAIARNNQNPVDNRDLKSNHPLMVTLHHRLFAEKLKGSEKRYYLLRKQGEKQVVMKEEQDAKWKYFWVDADMLARCIAAVLRQEPSISQQGTNDIFGKFFTKVFPSIDDPSHNRCKYAYWLVTMIERSYDGKARWKGVKDRLIERQKDFKRDAEWIVSALVADRLKKVFSFGDNVEKRFVEYCEQWRVAKSTSAVDEFEEIALRMFDDAFRLLHAIAKSSLGKQLPKSKGSYAQYDDLFKGPNYEYILKQVNNSAKMIYQKRLRRSMGWFVDFLEQG